MSRIIVTEKPGEWTTSIEGIQSITPSEYFKAAEFQKPGILKIINLCKSYQYQSLGYYVSLLAEARKHKVLPEVSTIQDFRFPSLIRQDASDFDAMIQQSFSAIAEERIEFNIYFGSTGNLNYTRIGILLYNLFPVPILKAAFIRKDKWSLQSLRIQNLSELSPEEQETCRKAMEFYLTGKKIINKNYARKKYDLAILVNPEDSTPPSNSGAIQKFVKTAEKRGFNTELISKNDYGKLIQFDVLFIRETTSVNHHTYRFAKKARAEGLVIFDDPESILRCTNKIYLYEILRANGIRTPESRLLRKDDYLEVALDFEYPFILKRPDGAFSKGIVKVNSKTELKKAAKELFRQSEILLVQEFLPTPFDWRVGIINQRVIYVCKYYMAADHWQIYNWQKEGKSREGHFDSVPVSAAPKKLIKAALAACKLIGDGLYGLDIKEKDQKYYIIEINDNPNIDAGVEDKNQKDVYQHIIDAFETRIKQRI